MHVLIIEDDNQLNTAICNFCEIKGFHVASETDGLKAIETIDSKTFDLYIIDINIPGMNGLDLLHYIRTTDIDTPIIIITASLEVKNFSTAFENGCSEYIKKPFHLKELDIRINNLLTNDKDTMISLYDDLTYDPNKEVFLYQGKGLNLRYKEKRFCAILMQHINTIVSNERICEYVWEGEIKETYPLRQLVLELRKKLPYDIVQTKVREGYIIENTQ